MAVVGLQDLPPQHHGRRPESLPSDTLWWHWASAPGATPEASILGGGRPRRGPRYSQVTCHVADQQRAVLCLVLGSGRASGTALSVRQSSEPALEGLWVCVSAGLESLLLTSGLWQQRPILASAVMTLQWPLWEGHSSSSSGGGSLASGGRKRPDRGRRRCGLDTGRPQLSRWHLGDAEPAPPLRSWHGDCLAPGSEAWDGAASACPMCTPLPWQW